MPRKTKKKKSLKAELARLATQIEALMKLRETIDLRFSSMSEKIGEIRSMVVSQEKENAELKKEIEKTITMVQQTQPDVLYTEFKKKEAEMSVLKDRIASLEQMVNTVLKDLRGLRKTVTGFRGIEGLMKVSKEVKDELRTVQKNKAEMEKYANKVASIFVEVQKRFKDIARLSAKVDSYEERLRSFMKEMSTMEVKISEMASKMELGEVTVNMEKMNEKMKEIENQLVNLQKTSRKPEEPSEELY